MFVSILVAAVIATTAQGMALVADADFGESQCDPILHYGTRQVRSRCFFPAPNDFHTVPDDQMSTGRRIAFSRAMMPMPFARRPLDPELWNALRDGWSASTFILLSGLGDDVAMDYAGVAVNGTEMRADGFASHMNIARSLDDDSPSLLIDAETGEKVAHWIEEDQSWDSLRPEPSLKLQDAEPNQRIHSLTLSQTILLHPAHRLKNSHRYIVAFRNLNSRNKRDANGEPMRIPPPEGFRLIRDDLPSNSLALEERRRHFQNSGIMATLDRHILDRSELVIAWDFTTSSLESATEHLRFMRDDGLARLANHVDYTVERIRDNYSSTIYRRIDGVFKVPLYLTTEKPVASARLARNVSAPTFLERLRPVFQSWANASFSIWIPRRAVESVKTKTGGMDSSGIGKASVMLYGHGLFQSLQEGDGVFLHEMANENNYIIVSTDWWGLQQRDIAAITRMVALDPSLFAQLPDRCSQGILNHLVLARILKEGGMDTDPSVLLIGGKSAVETIETKSGDGSIKRQAKNIFFYGNSLGGIMGTVYTALSTDTNAAVLGVPGGPFSVLFSRNPAGFQIISRAFRLHFVNSATRMAMLFLMHQLFEIADSTGYTDFLKKQIELGEKRVLIQYGVGDMQVNNVATLFLLRSLNATAFPNHAYAPQFHMDCPHDRRKKCLATRSFDRTVTKGHDGYTFLRLYNGTRVDTRAVSTVFHYENSRVLSFSNRPASAMQMFDDIHVLVRLTDLSKLQIADFFAVAAKGQDPRAWNVCAPKDSCWNMKRPSGNGMWGDS